MKIAPRYTEPTVHVLDASKSVVVVRQLDRALTFRVVFRGFFFLSICNLIICLHSAQR